LRRKNEQATTHLVDGVVGVRGITDGVGTTDESLERNVGHESTKSAKTLPRVLVKEPHRDVERRTTPALKSEGVLKGVRSLLGDVGHVDGTKTSREKRLVGVAPSRVHDEDAGVLADGLGEAFGTLLLDDVPPSGLARLGGVERLGLVLRVDEGRNGDLLVNADVAGLTLDRRTVNGEVSEVGEELLGAVLRLDEVEELGGVVDERRPGVAFDIGGVGEDAEEEGDVGLDTTDAELDEGAKHLATSDLEGSALRGALHEK